MSLGFRYYVNKGFIFCKDRSGLQVEVFILKKEHIGCLLFTEE